MLESSLSNCSNSFTGTSKVVQVIKRINLALFVQIAWTTWIGPMSYKPLLLNGLSTSNCENWVFCLLTIALTSMKESARNSVKVRNDSSFYWLTFMTSCVLPVWADHADAIAKAYGGSGALKSDFTRTNKRTQKGAIEDGYKSVMRYLKNNFFDGARQVLF